MLSSSNFQLSLFLMSTKSYLKFRTIRGTPQKWVGFAITCITLEHVYHEMQASQTEKVNIEGLKRSSLSKLSKTHDSAANIKTYTVVSYVVKLTLFTRHIHMERTRRTTNSTTTTPTRAPMIVYVMPERMNEVCT